jgi:hypothetical protein
METIKNNIDQLKAYIAPFLFSAVLGLIAFILNDVRKDIAQIKTVTVDFAIQNTINSERIIRLSEEVRELKTRVHDVEQKIK